MPEKIQGIVLRDVANKNALELNLEILSLLESQGIALLKSHLKTRGLLFPIDSPKLLVRAIFQGGIKARSKVFEALSKVEALNVAEVDQEVHLLIDSFSDLQKRLNRARFIKNSVTSHLDKLDERSLKELLQGKKNENEVNILLQEVNILNKSYIGSEEELIKWVRNVHKILIKLSQIFPTEISENLSSRLKKGFVSDKNLPKYLKDFEEYMLEIYASQFLSDDNNARMYRSLLSIREELQNPIKKINLSSSTYNKKLEMPNQQNKYRLIQNFKIKNANIFFKSNVSPISQGNLDMILKNIQLVKNISPDQKIYLYNIADEDFEIELEIHNFNDLNISEIKSLLNSAL